MKTWLVVDSNYLCHRAFHTTRELEYKAVKTGVLFGFFRDILTLQDLFNTHRIVFCFDYGKGKRRRLLRGYKSSRRKRLKQMTDEEQLAYKAMRSQVRKLRSVYLPQMGFRNIFFKKGYEADDVIASVVHNLPKKHDAVIISSDQDLYQLLVKDRVCIYNPYKKSTMTHEGFVEQYGIDPALWPQVKAIAGCPTDDIPGIKGVGEVTAAKFIAGTLKPESKAFSKIVHAAKTWDKNLPLVTLPLAGTPVFPLESDDVTERKWNTVMRELGMTSLLGEGPTIRTSNDGEKKKTKARKRKLKR